MKKQDNFLKTILINLGIIFVLLIYVLFFYHGDEPPVPNNVPQINPGQLVPKQ